VYQVKWSVLRVLLPGFWNDLNISGDGPKVKNEGAFQFAGEL
jgi:hypothetical protein